MTRLVFLDTETTSLRPDRRAWDIALIVRAGEPDAESQVFIAADDLDLGNADPISLRIGHFYERHPDYIGDASMTTWSEHLALEEIERLTRGAHLVGAVPNFDAEVLATRMRAHGIAPSWHYHLIDVETLAAGAMKMVPPWDFDKVLALYSLTYDEADRHTAIGDARMAARLYDAVMTR